MNTTIVAQSTAQGVAGIHIVRMSGVNAIDIASKIIQKSIAPSVLRCTSWLYDNEGNSIDHALLNIFQAPDSFTGENVIEFNTHGNQLIVHKLIKTCIYHGAVLAEPGEFSQRAYLNDKISLIEAEAINDLIHAKSEKLLQATIKQYQGEFYNQLIDIRHKLQNILTSIQAILDFPLDIDKSDREVFEQYEITNNINNVKAQLSKLQNTAKSTCLLRNGLKTVILGLPNVGKSSLLNYLTGYKRALVSDIPGTTRDYLEECIVLGDIPLQLVDTAGIRSNSDNIQLDSVEEQGIQYAWDLVEGADLVLFVLDSSIAEASEYSKHIELLNKINISNKNLIIIFNKIDLLDSDSQDINQLCDNYKLDPGNNNIIKFSAINNIGINDLIKALHKIVDINSLKGEFEISITQRQYIYLNQCFDAVNNLDLQDLSLMSNGLDRSITFINELLGDKTQNVEDILSNIFGNFCIGK